MADPGFYQGNEQKISETAARLHDLEAKLATAYQRWEDLDQEFNSENPN